ncbi:MAG: OmpA family protein [Geminicoccaceae bacterium]|nr:OmpA family protein [Geminicoccaceae bacterium]
MSPSSLTGRDITESVLRQVEIRRSSLSPIEMRTSRLAPAGPDTSSLGPGGLRQSTLSVVDRLETELGARETERGTLVSLPGDVLFDFDEADIRPDAATTLARLAELIRHKRPDRVLVEGHTDAKGSDAYNLELSLARARAVEDWLVQKERLDPAPIRIEGFGEKRPVAPNTGPDGADDPQGRQRNRRVEIVLQ